MTVLFRSLDIELDTGEYLFHHPLYVDIIRCPASQGYAKSGAQTAQIFWFFMFLNEVGSSSCMEDETESITSKVAEGCCAESISGPVQLEPPALQIWKWIGSLWP